jgi:TRAP-type C4-dicarboxylate transport system permease small subunit
MNLRISHYITALLLFIMAAIAFINVLSRYLFHFSFAATEEITINLFVWMTVLGTGIAFERGGHLGMVTIYNLFPRKMKKVVILFSAALSSILFLVVNAYMMPVWIYYLGVPVFSVYVFQGIYRNASKQLSNLEGDL